MTALIDDTDWEVRLRACKLLHELWNAERQNLSRSKRGNVNDITQEPHFYNLGGDKLLVLAVSINLFTMSVSCTHIDIVSF
jgi:hypothetical protein